MFPEPSRSLFQVTVTEAWLLTAAASILGLAAGTLVARWVNRLCETPPRPKEARVTALLTAGLFAFATRNYCIGSDEDYKVHPGLAWVQV